MFINVTELANLASVVAFDNKGIDKDKMPEFILELEKLSMLSAKAHMTLTSQDTKYITAT